MAKSETYVILDSTHIMPLAGALFFTFYFSLYGSVEAEAKLKLVLELTGMMFPPLDWCCCRTEYTAGRKSFTYANASISS